MSTRGILGIGMMILLLAGFSQGEKWQMKQRDMQKTGRADYTVPADRQNDRFFDDILWQTVTTGAFVGSGFVFFDGAGPLGADVAVCGNTWPNRVTAVDRHTGKLFWQDTPGGGDSIGQSTQAFSNDGTVIYAINDSLTDPVRTILAWHTVSGPAGGVWDNRFDADPWELAALSPTVAPDGRIFMHKWDNSSYAGTDNGLFITRTWASQPSGYIGACQNDAALYMDGETLKVVQAGRTGRISCFDGSSGAELWTVLMYEGTDASVTIDPDNGNSYVSAGLNGDIYVVGLDRNGNPLWADSKMPVYDYQEGQNDWERAQSTGCLSHDGSTYYFQTIGPAANGKLYAVNTADGSVRWSNATHSYYPYETWASSPIVTRNGIVVVGTNLSGEYLAVRDDGDHATLLDSLKVEPGLYEPYPTLAQASVVISADGKMYIPYRTYWTVGNGDNGTPSGGVEYCLTAFDLSGCDPVDGDLNGDCRVNIMDLAILSSNWLNCGMQPESRCLE